MTVLLFSFTNWKFKWPLTSKAGASAAGFFGLGSRNRQHTSDGTYRRGIDSCLWCRSDFGAVGGVSAAATMVLIRCVNYSARARPYLTSKYLVNSCKPRNSELDLYSCELVRKVTVLVILVLSTCKNTN